MTIRFKPTQRVSAFLLIGGFVLAGCSKDTSFKAEAGDQTGKAGITVNTGAAANPVPQATPTSQIIYVPVPAASAVTVAATPELSTAPSVITASPTPRVAASTAPTKLPVVIVDVKSDFDRLFQGQERRDIGFPGPESYRYNRIVNELLNLKENRVKLVKLAQTNPTLYRQTLEGLKDSVFCGGLGCFDPKANDTVSKAGFDEHTFKPTGPSFFGTSPSQ